MKSNVTVEICTDYVTRDPAEVQKILDRVSEIISKSYARRMREGDAKCPR